MKFIRILYIKPVGRIRKIVSSLFLLPLVFSSTLVQAQEANRPLFDGITVGPGLAVYVGDLDGNPNESPIQHLASSHVRFHVSGDRRYGNVSAGLELQFDRLDVERDPFRFSNNIISLDLVGGYHFDMIQSDLFQIRAGLGASLLIPQYKEGFLETTPGVNTLGTRVLLTFPMSVGIQNRVRFGFRYIATDFLDGFEGVGTGTRDFIMSLSVGYRFDLTR